MDKVTEVNQWLKNIHSQLKLNEHQCHMLDKNGYAVQIQLSTSGHLISLSCELYRLNDTIDHELANFALELNANSEILRSCWLAKHEDKLLLMHHVDIIHFDGLDFENTLNNFLSLSGEVRQILPQSSSATPKISDDMPFNHTFYVKG
ncbi:hypothetical protein [Shewanella sp. SR44-3]|uniref:hypothetical protein n=1 Tax=Shewanella sp. SR44-3 TaxID=2760936 RepID=UPI0015FDB359|nr:hypothetical protein [Shewanella sp. SR44-3]MBB1269468.1 hypothetical protein [Shewanella sp. SR44-3]